MNSEACKGMVSESEVDQRRIMERFQELQALPDPPIILTNVYKEIPITHTATLCEVKETHVELKTSELQLASISHCNEAYLQSPLLDWTLLGRLCSIDIRRCSVRLSDFREAELDALKRRTVRVRLRKPIGVRLQLQGETIAGMIHDISLGGCCINTVVKKGLPDARRVEMEFALTPHCQETVRIPCTVVGVEGSAPPYRCTFSFNHNGRTEQFLSVFVYQRQLEIVRELKETLC